MYVEANCFSLASHLYWGIWALVQVTGWGPPSIILQSPRRIFITTLVLFLTHMLYPFYLSDCSYLFQLLSVSTFLLPSVDHMRLLCLFIVSCFPYFYFYSELGGRFKAFPMAPKQTSVTRLSSGRASVLRPPFPMEISIRLLLRRTSPLVRPILHWPPSNSFCFGLPYPLLSASNMERKEDCFSTVRKLPFGWSVTSAESDTPRPFLWQSVSLLDDTTISLTYLSSI